MNKQIMQYTIQKRGVEFKQGLIIAEGSTVYEMTENVVNNLEELHELSDLDFIDVSNFWIFHGTHDYESITLEFAPIDTPADKFGLED